ncbi:hypothetical protein [Vibrio sp. SCSIO 43136]|uniref:hypothetical protein n=1 Tax=Vibrio sp. SCSIO 43136 TaxID=2819101 RepID=UPI002075BB55|nr:hypothetical protein [Vibrio sp. SCSIO 43136]USD68146.1 hypothetical protein J4N39_18400 [Vibrio sp. SCSIO 43136]
MTHEDYKAARAELGYNVQGWIEKLGISMDTHKSYNSGRKEVMQPVVNHINTLLSLNKIQKSVLETLK